MTAEQNNDGFYKPDGVKGTPDLDLTDSRQTGQCQDVRENFSVFSAVGIAFSITNSAIGILLSLGTQVYFGGGPAYFYGYIISAIIGACTAITLGELSSMYPHPGGQYYWVTRLCTGRFRRLLSYIIAILAWAGAVTTGASAVLVVSEIIMGMAKLMHPAFAEREQPWMVFLIFQATNLLAIPVNCHRTLIGRFGKFALVTTCAGLLVIFIAVLAKSPTKQPASTVLVDLINNSGWSDGVAFLIGLNTPNWSFSCLDATTHLTEEVPDPRRNVPKILLLTVLIGLVTGLPVLLAMYFSIQSIEDAINGASGVFSMEVFLQAFSGNRSAAIGLQFCILLSAFGAVIGIHTWQSRLAWALARDQGFPFHKYLGFCSQAFQGLPVWAHLWSVLWTAVCGCLYLASTAAFSSLLSAGIILQYITYSVPIICLSIKGRSKVQHGPFWLPRLGLICNIVVVLWTAFVFVVYSLPYYIPVEAGTMNYVCVVLFILIIYALVYWFAKGRRSYTIPDEEDELADTSLRELHSGTSDF